jgi:putative sterol carrier protein
MSETSLSESLLRELSNMLNPDAAQGLNAYIQFFFGGSESDAWYLYIHNGQCTLYKGALNFAHLTIRVDVNVWQEIQNGKISFTEAMMQRKFLATGNFTLLARFPQFFNRFS